MKPSAATDTAPHRRPQLRPCNCERQRKMGRRAAQLRLRLRLRVEKRKQKPREQRGEEKAQQRRAVKIVKGRTGNQMANGQTKWKLKLISRRANINFKFAKAKPRARNCPNALDDRKVDGPSRSVCHTPVHNLSHISQESAAMGSARLEVTLTKLRAVANYLECLCTGQLLLPVMLSELRLPTNRVSSIELRL